MEALKELVHLYKYETVAKFINKRSGEEKFGEKIGFLKSLDSLKTHSATYVLVGIPEDIGVRANHGKAGTAHAWSSSLQAILNIQANELTRPESVVLLGEINCDKQLAQASKIADSEPHSKEELGNLVIQIDHKVENLVRYIVEAGKIPILIGGGHNNSYGNLSGCSQALDKKINCINFDAHTDFRSLEHRHSGNGFSYAYDKGYLRNYYIFGLHRNYTSQDVFERMKKVPEVKYTLFEDIQIKKKISFEQTLLAAENYCGSDDFGIELDMDAIENMGSSAMTSSGFRMTQARQFLAYFSKHPNLRYVHICEGAPKTELFPNAVAKAIAYLITDCIAQ